MMDHPSDSGYELVLDNRRLIVAFAVLVLFCGCIFVIGFIEGKRQGFQAGAQTAADSVAKPGPDSSQAAESHAATTDTGTKPLKDQPEDHPLEWYKNVSGRQEKPEIAAPPVAASSSSKEPAAKPTAATDPKPPEKAAATAPASYTVQVGAFRQRQQVDAKAEALRAKGFDSRIEPPDSAEGLFLLKVGKFRSRADAVAMQLRLKKDGFTSFIKTD